MSRETKEVIRCDRCGRVFEDGHYGIKFHYEGRMPTTLKTNISSDTPVDLSVTINWKELCKRCYIFACRIQREIMKPAGKNKEVKKNDK